MSLLSLLVLLVVIGVVLYLINRYIPMVGWVKDLLNIVVAIVLIVILLRAFGVWGSLNNIN